MHMAADLDFGDRKSPGYLVALLYTIDESGDLGKMPSLTSPHDLVATMSLMSCCIDVFTYGPLEARPWNKATAAPHCGWS